MSKELIQALKDWTETIRQATREMKYSPDQERADNGQFGSGSGGGATADKLQEGAPVIVSGKVFGQGKRGVISSFGQDKRFVVVKFPDGSKTSFHSSDVIGHDADEDEDEDEE